MKTVKGILATAIASSILVMGMGAPATAAPKNDWGCAVSSTIKSKKVKKVIVVDSTSKTKANVTQCERKSNGAYKRIAMAYGTVGYNGMVSGKSKKEGDGKTPTGTYPMGVGFGVKSKPSSFKAAKYTKVTTDHVWVDGKAKKKYNTMQRKSKGYKGESLYQTPAYNYAQEVKYNPKGTPGRGSAIFLHVNTNSGKTAGCISVKQAMMLRIMKWEAKGGVWMVIKK